LLRGEAPAVPWGKPYRLPPFFAGPLGELGTLGLASIQSELTVAASGLQIVAGFNDFRGGGSFSGVIYSLDGGATFNDGGQLPTVAPATVDGDPVLGVFNPIVGPSVFYYSSLYGNAIGQRSLSVHSSNDGGQTWTGPLEVTSATTPADFPDKEWLAVDPETGRIHLSWSNFGAVVRIMTTYSDDGGVNWSVKQTVSAASGQGSVVACDPNGPNVYIAWRTAFATNPSTSAVTFVRSTDNGATWSAPVHLAPSFFSALPAYGFDRFNNFPNMAVNPVDGGLELVYVAASTGLPTGDFGDVFYRRSTDSGVTWSAPLQINIESGVGADRPQIFPGVSADADGRIDMLFYDQSAGSDVSDITDMFTTSSSDFGATWEPPVPVTQKPFHNEVGNNYGAPHQGDYNHSVSLGGTHYAAFAWNGEPDPLGPGVDAMVSISTTPGPVSTLRVRPGSVSFVDFNCSADDGLLVAGESARLTIPLENFGSGAMTVVSAVLTSLTAGVTTDVNPHSYPNIAPGASEDPTTTFDITLDPSYPCGQPANFHLFITTNNADPTFVEFSLPTGVHASVTSLLAESFDGVVAPALPAGWSFINQCGSCSPSPWVTSVTTPASAPNAAFVPDAGFLSFSRLQGPVLAVPGGTTHLVVTYDQQYDLEQLDARIAFDGGSFNYLVDGSASSHFATADALSFEPRYRHWVNRASGNTRGDRSGWSGSSAGYQTVSLVIPNLGGHTFRPLWDLTTDGSVGAPGWWVDNVNVRAVTLDCGTCTPVGVGDPSPSRFAVLGARPNPMVGAGEVAFTLPRPLPVWASVYSVEGRMIRKLTQGEVFGAGANRVEWNGRDASGRRVPAGIYWVHVRSAEGQGRARVVVLP
jgi:hypothetical protein